jgi:hypothetical protein
VGTAGPGGSRRCAIRLFDIALKDLLRSFTSACLLVIRFVAPLLVTALLCFAFGRSGGGKLSLPATRVQVTIAPDEAGARTAVEQQDADVALLIPANFTVAAMDPAVPELKRL